MYLNYWENVVVGILDHLIQWWFMNDQIHDLLLGVRSQLSTSPTMLKSHGTTLLINDYNDSNLWANSGGSCGVHAHCNPWICLPLLSKPPQMTISHLVFMWRRFLLEHHTNLHLKGKKTKKRNFSCFHRREFKPIGPNLLKGFPIYNTKIVQHVHNCMYYPSQVTIDKSFECTLNHLQAHLILQHTHTHV